jgi:hypothetical protein
MKSTRKPTRNTQTRAPTSLIAILTEAPYRDQVDPIKYPVALITHAPSSSVIMETEAPYYDKDEINPVKFPLPAYIP